MKIYDEIKFIFKNQYIQSQNQYINSYNTY